MTAHLQVMTRDIFAFVCTDQACEDGWTTRLVQVPTASPGASDVARYAVDLLAVLEASGWQLTAASPYFEDGVLSQMLYTLKYDQG